MSDGTDLEQFLDSLLTAQSAVDLKWELTSLRAIRTWALEHLGVDYAAGDRVEIAESFGPIGSDSGWHPYREALIAGATATVRKIDFNAAHGYWYADIVLDAEWTRGDYRGITRHWHGPADLTPDGMTPPSDYDREHHPDGRKHTFGMAVEHLRLAPSAPSETNEP